MRWMRGKCECGEDHVNLHFNGFDWIIAGLIIGGIFCFNLGVTQGINEQKQAETQAWEDER